MPVVTLFTNAPKDEAHDKEFAKKLSATSAGCLSKPEQYLMTVINSGTTMTMAGSDEPCACIKIASIGAVTPDMNKATCE